MLLGVPMGITWQWATRKTALQLLTHESISFHTYIYEQNLNKKRYNVLCNHRFHYEVNEIGWNNTGELFFLTTGLGTVEILRWMPATNELIPIRTIHAHTANTYCIEFDPLNKYFAVGSADAVVTLWGIIFMLFFFVLVFLLRLDINEMVCVRSFCKLQYPLRTISFSHDGQFLALASEDHIIGIFGI